MATSADAAAASSSASSWPANTFLNIVERLLPRQAVGVQSEAAVQKPYRDLDPMNRNAQFHITLRGARRWGRPSLRGIAAGAAGAALVLLLLAGCSRPRLNVLLVTLDTTRADR